MIAGYILFVVVPASLPAVVVVLILFYLPAQSIQMTTILSMTDSIEYGQLENWAAERGCHTVCTFDV